MQAIELGYWFILYIHYVFEINLFSAHQVTECWGWSMVLSCSSPDGNTETLVCNKNHHHLSDVVTCVICLIISVSASPYTASPVELQWWPSDPDVPYQSDKKNTFGVGTRGWLVGNTYQYIWSRWYVCHCLKQDVMFISDTVHLCRK